MHCSDDLLLASTSSTEFRNGQTQEPLDSTVLPYHTNTACSHSPTPVTGLNMW